MKRLLCFLFALLAGAAHWADAQTVEVNSPADYAAGHELLAQLRQRAATRKPVLSRPHVFIRSQTKYSGRLYADTYNWHDRPLFASRLLWDDGPSDHKISSFARSFELYRSYGLDGFATFAWPGAGEYLRTMKPIYDTAAQMKLDPQQFHIMLEVSSGEDYLDIDDNTFQLITENPYSFRVNGKSVISSYVLDRRPPEQLAKLLQPLRDRSENRVLILPQIHFIHLQNGAGQDINIGDIHDLYRLHDGALPASLLRAMQEYLRSYARVCDGLYIGPLQSKLDRSADAAFSAEVLAPLFKSVLAEPEFAGKLFALQTKVGYTSYHGAQSLSRDGTKTLRAGFDLAERFQPDLLIGTEWDELNEDTGFEPLVAKPMSSQRIIKYYMSRFKGQAPAPNPGDDLSLPNLIISQRRQILPGVMLDIELLNVPDTADGEAYTVALELLNEKGEVLYQSPPEAFNSAQLKDKTFALASENFKDAQALRPRLAINYRGTQRVLEAGLPFTVVRATTAWDQTYFCTPLRNVLQPQKAAIAFGPAKPIADGVAEVPLSVEVQAPEKLAYAEVVQDSLETFAYDAQNEYLQNDPQRRLIEFTCGYVNNPSRIYVDLQAEIKGAPSAHSFTWPVADSTPKTAVRNVRAAPAPAFEEGSKRWKADWWLSSRQISLLAGEMENAVLAVEGTRATGPRKGEKFSWSLPLKELGEYGVISKVFEDGLVLAVQTQYRPSALPLPLETQTLQFQHRVIADDPNGVLALRLVSEDGKVFWSRPFAVNATPSPETVTVPVYSSSAKKGITLALPKDRVPDIKYDFTPRWGNILHTVAGRQFYGHAGSYTSIATNFVGLESASFATPFYLYNNNIFKGADRPAPQWVEYEPGQWALSFDGERGNFLGLPNIAIPQRAGFMLEFEVKPRQVKPAQVLFANEAYSFGTINLSVRDGKFQINFTRRTPDRPDLPAYSQGTFKTNIPLRAGEWQKVVLSYDENKLTLSANGQSESFPFEGIGLYLQQSVFGGRGDRTKEGVIPFYDGLLRSLEIKHYVER